MKIKEVRDLDKQALKEKIDEWEGELFNLRFQMTIGQLSNPVRMRMVRRDIARAKTVLGEKETQPSSQG